MPNREIRRVPLDWKHPADKNGKFVPLFARDSVRIAKYRQDGRTEEEITADFMPEFTGVPRHQMGICVYETTSEGTPLTPVFPTTKPGRIALVHFCAANVPAFAHFYVHARTWAQVLFGDDRMVFSPEDGDFEPAKKVVRES